MIAKYGSLLWIAIAVFLWVYMTGRDFNLLISVFLGSALLTWALLELSDLPFSVCAGAGITIVTAGMFVCMIAGDWAPKYRIPSTCIITTYGTFHIHHWVKGGLTSLWNAKLRKLLRAAPDEQTRKRVARRFSRPTFVIAGILLASAIILAVFNVGTKTLWIDAAGYSAYFALLGGVCLEGKTERSAFKFYTAVSFCIALAIFGNGLIVEIGREMIHGGKIPSSLIWWTAGVDAACH